MMKRGCDLGTECLCSPHDVDRCEFNERRDPFGPTVDGGFNPALRMIAGAVLALFVAGMWVAIAMGGWHG